MIQANQTLEQAEAHLAELIALLSEKAGRKLTREEALQEAFYPTLGNSWIHAEIADELMVIEELKAKQ